MTVCKASYATNGADVRPVAAVGRRRPAPGASQPDGADELPRLAARRGRQPARGVGRGGHPEHPDRSPGAARENEGQTVLTNGTNVGARGGTPASPGALAAGAQKLPVPAGQGYRFQMVNASAIRYLRLRLTTEAGTEVVGLARGSARPGQRQPGAPGRGDAENLVDDVARAVDRDGAEPRIAHPLQGVEVGLGCSSPVRRTSAEPAT